MANSKAQHRIWAQVDLDNLVHNYRQVRQIAAGREVLCVIKADAYGHGAVPVAKALAAAGATHFAVATPEEALRLRRGGVSQYILLLDTVPAHWAPVMAAHNIAMAVGSLSVAQGYAQALEGGRLAVHIKLNTGMNRLGLDPDAAPGEALRIAALPGFVVEGVFTHFPSADEQGDGVDFTARQIERFHAAVDAIEAKGLRIPLRHLANSAGILCHPAGHGDMVRPGIMLYGSNPCPHIPCDLRPVLALKSAVGQLVKVPKGQAVSYNRTWTAPRDSLVAVVTAGYADGLPRVASGKIDMLVNGARAPQVGRICMDMCMLDVTGLPGIQEGDVVTIIGRDGEHFITADELAGAAGTISYEVLCAVGLRVPRLYYQDGRLIDSICYLDKL